MREPHFHFITAGFTRFDTWLVVENVTHFASHSFSFFFTVERHFFKSVLVLRGGGGVFIILVKDPLSDALLNPPCRELSYASARFWRLKVRLGF